MKNLLLIILLVPVLGIAQIYSPDGLRLPGDWNGFTNTLNMGGNFDLVKNSTGTVRWQTKFQFTGTTGEQKFKFASGGSGNPWANQWYIGDFNIEDISSMNTLVSYSWTTDGNVKDNKVIVTNSKWYSVNWKDNGYANTQAIFMETSGEPVTITNVINNFTTRGTGNDGTVTITLNNAKSAEEKIYVRYTTDGWATSSFVEATGSGTTYTATIPNADIAAYNGNDEYYVLTTTVASPTHADADMVTINLNNNNGSNYPLPVELTSLNASVVGATATLKWSTATETNNAGFEVQRKKNSGWVTLAFIEGHGTTNASKEYSFSDKSLSPGRYSYRLKQIDRDGAFDYSREVEAFVQLSDKDYSLSPNYPNPFNPSTTFTFAVKQRQHVAVRIYNLVGQEVATLVNGIVEPNTLQTVRFDGTNIPSGVYFYSLRTADRHEVRKLMLMK